MDLKKIGESLRAKPAASINLTDGSEKEPGDWNRMVIECLNDQIKVWVNGDFVNHGSKCTASEGKIAIQAEGSEVEFRKLALTGP